MKLARSGSCIHLGSESTKTAVRSRILLGNPSLLVECSRTNVPDAEEAAAQEKGKTDHSLNPLNRARSHQPAVQKLMARWGAVK
jgi:hypothetical protein